MKIIILLILLSPSVCFAEVSGYLFLSRYLNHEETGRDIAHKAGAYLELKTKGPTLFIKEETAVRDILNGKSFPKQIDYTAGVKHKYKALEVILTHKRLHPVDSTSGGARSYNSIEGRFNF